MFLFSAAAPPFHKNGFVVGCEDTREAVVIDPGDEVQQLLDAVSRMDLSVRAILLTHAHIDHITGVGQAKRAIGTGAPIWLHRDDLFLYDGILEQGALFGLPVTRQPPIDAFYDASTRIAFGRYVIDVRHTPGHCPGGVCLAVGRQDHAAQTLFVGDTLFAGSIGRTDLPGGDYDVLIASIRDVLFSFPDDTPVHSGHGPPTTIGHERRTNPFLS